MDSEVAIPNGEKGSISGVVFKAWRRRRPSSSTPGGQNERNTDTALTLLRVSSFGHLPWRCRQMQRRCHGHEEHSHSGTHESTAAYSRKDPFVPRGSATSTPLAIEEFPVAMECELLEIVDTENLHCVIKDRRRAARREGPDSKGRSIRRSWFLLFDHLERWLGKKSGKLRPAGEKVRWTVRESVWRPPFEAGSPRSKTEEALKENPCHHWNARPIRGAKGLSYLNGNSGPFALPPRCPSSLLIVPPPAGSVTVKQLPTPLRSQRLSSPGPYHRPRTGFPTPRPLVTRRGTCPPGRSGRRSGRS